MGCLCILSYFLSDIGRGEDYVQGLMRNTSLQAAVEQLDHLTNAELLAATAQINAIVRESTLFSLRIHRVTRSTVL